MAEGDLWITKIEVGAESQEQENVEKSNTPSPGVRKHIRFKGLDEELPTILERWQQINQGFFCANILSRYSASNSSLRLAMGGYSGSPSRLHLTLFFLLPTLVYPRFS